MWKCPKCEKRVSVPVHEVNCFMLTDEDVTQAMKLEEIKRLVDTNRIMLLCMHCTKVGKHGNLHSPVELELV